MSDEWNQDEDSFGITGYRMQQVNMMHDEGITDLVCLVLIDNDEDEHGPFFIHLDTAATLASHLADHARLGGPLNGGDLNDGSRT